uniref:Transcriptional regulator, HxlR family n=1 Tax=Sphingobacterium sp. (strain 21) TaxID=743722 RepID=F4C7R4_SPHS2
MSYSRQATLSCDNNSDASCSVEAALSIISGKWKLKIYKILQQGTPVRFSMIAKGLGDVSEKSLSFQLREMENDGLIVRTVYPEVPPRVEYSLTDLGKSLQIVFESLDVWGKAYIKANKLGV